MATALAEKPTVRSETDVCDSVAIPESMPAVLGGVAPYLSVSDARAAAEFYKRAFRAEEVAAMPPDASGRTMHIHLRINGGSVMLSDPYPEHGHPLRTPQGITLHQQHENVRAAWAQAVEAGASVLLPLEVAFWGDRYGQLRDPFDVTWSLGGPA